MKIQLLCNKKFGWPVPPVPGSEPLNPQNFLSDRSIFVIHGGI